MKNDIITCTGFLFGQYAPSGAGGGGGEVESAPNGQVLVGETDDGSGGSGGLP